ncbi:MAG: helical backbone metal receptor [Longimicrobiales bacterium]|nr:helical backbone metal receptor [Longimicrobiales bacterium]
MRRGRLLLPLLGALGPVALGACGTAGESGSAEQAEARGLTLVDADGREVRLARPAERLVSLVPSATLTLAALGASSALVARTDHDTASWTAPLPSVGGGLQPSLEAIVAARPDLVIRFSGPQDTRTPAGLDQLGIPHVGIRPDRIADVLESIRLLGRATGRDAAADSLVARIESGLDSVRASASGRPPVRVAYVLGGDPPWVAGPGTYIDELLRLAGGENVFADLGTLYAAVSVEEFLARQIDLLITPDAGRIDPRVLGAAPVSEVGDALELPGPGVTEAAWTLARILRPPGAP